MEESFEYHWLGMNFLVLSAYDLSAQILSALCHRAACRRTTPSMPLGLFNLVEKLWDWLHH